MLLIWGSVYYVDSKVDVGMGNMAQSWKCLLHKHENLSLDLQYLCEELGVSEHICSSITGERETGEPLDLTGQ